MPSPLLHSLRRSPRALLRGVAAGLLVAAAAYLAALKLGGRPAPLNLLLWLPAALFPVLAVVAGLAVVAAVRGPRRVTPAAEAFTAVAVAALLAVGLANWALRFQGAVILVERTPVSLTSWDELAAVAAGPLYDRRELDVTIALAKLRLEGVAADRFRAVSRLRVLPAGGEERGLDVATSPGARVGKLVFFQGAFGFAPRIVITRDGAQVLDTHVPFRTVREGPDGVSFEGDFEVAAERLSVHGAVTLEDLNDDMKGHPKLELAVDRDGAPLGSGSLRPGEFADVGGGLRVGFAGLSRWAEILFFRHGYGRAALACAVAAALAAAAWGVAAWRRW